MLGIYLLALLGFVLLIGSGRFLVKASVSLAAYFGVSTLVIGVTVVAFGTSAPELLVSVQAALNGHPEIALGNVIGSNISNIALVLALTAIILPIPVKRSSFVFDWPFMMAVSILFYVFSLDLILGRGEGIVFNILLVAFVVFSIRRSKQSKQKTRVQDKESVNIYLTLGIIIASCLGLIFGAKFLVDSAVYIAGELGVSERAISISMIAIGTSLPELSTSIIAAIQKETDISVGNIIGSNIFNILSVLGITSIIKPIQLTQLTVDVDILWMLAISALLFLLILPLKKPGLSRFKGFFLLSVYVFYIYRVFTT